MTHWKSALRLVWRRPAFTITTVTVLAFGIGANSALFSVVDTVLVKPLPYPDPGQLVQILDGNPSKDQRESLISPARLADWNRLSNAFEAISGSYTENVTDNSLKEPERLGGRRVAPGYFRVFSTPPLIGRTFLPAEERFGGPQAAVISEGLWERRYRRSPDVISRRLLIGDSAYSIVGVMPRAFAVAAVEVWMPAQVNAWLLGYRPARFYSGVGRMKHGVSLAQGTADLERVSRRLGETFPETDKGWSPLVTDYKASRVGGSNRSLWLVGGSAAMLLLILCANVAGLLLGQLRQRERELAIRASLGASGAQITAVVLREVTILAVLSGSIGLGMAYLSNHAMARLFADLPRMQEMRFDWRITLFTVAVTLGSAVVFGLLPALQAVRRTLRASVQQGGRSVAGGHRRLQQMLVGAQFAVTIVLLAGAGLMLRSYHNLTQVQPGFHADHVVTFHVGAGWGEDRPQIGRIQQNLIAGLEREPGISVAGLSNFLPASEATLREQVALENVTRSGGEADITVGTRSVTSGYLRALQVPLLAGGVCPEFRPPDKGIHKVLVNQRFAEVAGVSNLVGRRIVWTTLKGSAGSLEREIAGVVANVREDALNAAPVPYVYVCLDPGEWPDPEYVVSGALGTREMIAAVRRVAHQVAPNRAVFGAISLTEYLDETLDKPKLNAGLLGVFAMSALVSAALGLYGLVMLTVTSRTKEIGIRMALGAPSLKILASAIGEAVGPMLTALGVGAGIAYPVLRAFRSLFFDVSPADAITALSVCGLLFAVSAVAAYLPARRAVRIDPVDALRNE